MRAAVLPPAARDEIRSLRLGADGSLLEVERVHLLDTLRPGDVVVFNDAATLPASLPARVELGGQPHGLELRLAGPVEHQRGWGVLFGAGSWRDDTDDRPAPPALCVGDPLEVAGLPARVVSVSPLSPRLVCLRFDAPQATIVDAIYRHGSAVQYSHLQEPLELWSIQTIWAGRPWSVEMPSAGRSFTWTEVESLRARGIAIATLTHAAGLSATGDAALDAALPLPERFDIPQATVDAIERARSIGGRVVAVGTSVARALEGATTLWGALRAGSGVTDLRLGPHTNRLVVDAIITGMHAPGESHYELLGSFAGRETLKASHEFATRAGFASHEFGDIAFVEGEPVSRRTGSHPSLARGGQRHRRRPSPTACSEHRPESSA